MPRTVISGEAGTAYTNDTGVTLFQFLCDWNHSCGLCVSRDHQVGSYWPIPIHRRCRCRQTPVLPDATARPFVDYRAKILTVSPAQQAAIMGRANLALVEKGVVKWDDVVTPGRIRSLREVVSRNKLTVEQMVRAGVSRYHASEAFDAVNTGTHTAAEIRRQVQIDSLLAQGYTKDHVRNAVAGALATRLTIGSGPSGPSAVPSLAPTPKPVPSRVAALAPAKPTAPATLTANPRIVRVAVQILGAIRRAIKILKIPLEPEEKSP